MPTMLQDIQSQREMCLDAIQYWRDTDREPDPKLFEVLAEYDAKIARWTGVSLPATPAITDDVVTVGRQAGSAAGNQYGTFQVHAATDRMVWFLQKLIDTKVTDGVKLPTTLVGISKTAASALIDKLIDRPEKPGVATGNPASPKQIEWVKRLLGEKDLTGTAFEALTVEMAEQLSKPAATKALDILFNLPNKPKAKDENNPLENVPAGRYAVLNGDGVVSFYQIDKPDQGKWAGWTFVKLLVGSVGDFSEVAQKGAAGIAVAKKILEAGLEESARLFGQKTKTCGRCSSPLTTHQSRAAGYGEHCAGMNGFWYPTSKEALALLEEGQK